MHPPRFDQLRTLVAFADSGSCKGAASIVARSEAAVSMQLHKLEEYLGRPLFHKTGRRLTLTEFGSGVVTDARKIMAICDGIRLRAAGTTVPTCLKIGAPDDYLTLVHELLDVIRSAFPSTRLELICLPSQDLRPLLLAGKLDMALLSCDDDSEPGIFIRRVPIVWCGSTLAERGPLQLVLFPEGCIMRKRALAALDRMPRDYQIAYTSSNLAALRGIVAQSRAIAPIIDMDLPAGFTRIEGGLPALDDITVKLRFAPGPSQGWQQTLSQTIGTPRAL